MPFVNVPGTYQVNMKFLLDGQLVENVYGVRSDDGETPLSMAQVAQTFDDWWADELRMQLSTGISLREIVVRDLSSETAGSYVHTPSSFLTGAVSQPSMPNNVAFVISHRTAQAGRSFRGRTYISGIPRTVVSGNTMDAGVISDLIAAFGQLRTLLENINAVIVVISRIHNGVERLTGLSTVVSAFTAVDATVDSQRRRLPGRGR